MRVRIPAARWAKQFARIVPGATSGWDILPPEGAPDFLPRSRDADLNAGDIFVTFEESAKAANKRCCMYIVLNGPLLFNHATCPSDSHWTGAMIAAGGALLHMPPASRCAWAVTRFLDQLERRQRVGGGLQQADQLLITRLTSLRAHYLSQISRHDVAAELAAPPYIHAAFEQWLNQTASVCDVSIDFVRRQLEMAASPASAPVSPPAAQPAQDLGRRLVLRRPRGE